MPYSSSSHQAEREGPLEHRSSSQPEQHSKSLCRDCNNFHTPRAGSAFKSTGCPFCKSRFNFQHTHGHAQPSETPAPKYSTPSSDLCGHCTQVIHRRTCRQSIMHIIFLKIKLNDDSPKDGKIYLER